MKKELKIDLRKLPKKNNVKEVVNILWKRYKKDLSTTGEIYKHKTKTWESSKINKKQFRAAITSFIDPDGSGTAKLKDIKAGIRRYENSQFYQGHMQRLERLQARDLFSSTETGDFNKASYNEFRQKALRDSKGRFEKFDGRKLKYEKEGYYDDPSQGRRHYSVQSYNGVFLIYWQSPNDIQITGDISWL